MHYSPLRVSIMSHLHAGVIKDSTGSLDDGLIDRTVPGSSTHHFHVELFKHVIYCFVVGAGFEGGDLAIEAVIDTVQTFHNVPGTGQEVDSEAGLYLLGWVTNYGGIGRVVCDALMVGGSTFHKFVKGTVLV